MNNRSSNAAVDKNICELPMHIGEGWQYLNLNIDDILMRCFGTNIKLCKEVVINGSCRISKVFFQEQLYSDVELPPFLRVIRED